MENEKTREHRYGPQLVFEERSFKCGYAPRMLLVSEFHRDTAFVGCKDGSVTVLRPRNDLEEKTRSGFLSLAAFEAFMLKTPQGMGAIRALCEWNDRQLLLARSGGTLEVSSWNNGDLPDFCANPKMGPIRYLARLDSNRIAVIFRDEGLTIIDQKEGEPLKPKSASSEPIVGIRAIFPLRYEESWASPKVWLLLTDRGDIYEWNGESDHDPVPAEGIWNEGRRPSLISDFCLLRNKTARNEEQSATEILLATDRGPYLLSFEPGEGQPETRRILRARRLALSGLNATPTVLSYTSYELPDGESREYLWVSDLQGDSHLFWGDGPRPHGESRFKRSGVHHSRSETLDCSLLADLEERPDSSFFVVQVLRNDRIVMGRYWNPKRQQVSEDPGGSHKDLALRKLLNFGIYPGASEGAQAIRSYLRDRFAEEGLADEETKEDWWEEDNAAIVAELFEYLAEDENRRQVLLESLRAPYAEAAQNVLISAAADSNASKLWRLAFLGILHRAPGDQTSSYLGLMRWLRHRQVELPKEGFEKISQALDIDLLLVRKWGLHGGVNRNREDLVEPQRVLMEQAEQAGKNPSEELERIRWERLTYWAELFGRSVNLIDEYKVGRLRGRTAWGTSVLPLAGHTLVAVSWMWGGVEIFALRNFSEGRPELRLLATDYSEAEAGNEPQHVLRRVPLGKSYIAPAKYGYSRIVHLGKVGEQVYLLSAPTSEPTDSNPGSLGAADLFVWLLPEDTEEMQEVRPYIIPLEGVGRSSIYSLLDLGNGRLVAGLRGEGLQASLALIDLHDIPILPALDLPANVRRVWKLPVSIGPTLTSSQGGEASEKGEKGDDREKERSIGRNRMWSLAKIAEPPGERYRIAFGCDSGEIYEVEVNWVAKSLGGFGHLIGRMGSPVLVLACREKREDGLIRVFAGGEDGAIVAWQEISPETPEQKTPGTPRFGTLWATVEQGAISQLHFLEVQGEPAVLAVTREGRYVTFNDRKEMAFLQDSEKPTRTPLPGSRHGRRSFHCSAFASSLIQMQSGLNDYWGAAEALGAFAALLVATDDGRLRLVSLHNPEATDQRKEQYKKIVDLWGEVLRQPMDFRLTESAYKSSPTLSRIVVRYLLDHKLGKHADDLKKAPWGLPRHLRPLFRLRLLWDKLRAGDVIDIPAAYREFEILLSLALERSWRIDDLSLFQEICQVVLRQANTGLYAAGEAAVEKSGSSQEVACGVFLSMLRAIERSLPRWLGADREREARARIAVAKHLVDGETARVLLREVAREKAKGESRPSKELGSEDLREEGKYHRMTFQQVFDERVRAVRELVNKRHPLVSLESLRAANLSLARMCRNLVEKRKQFEGNLGVYEPAKAKAVHKLEECEISWPVFRAYSEELVAAAAQAFRTPLELNDALAHEFSRTFALLICACPSATLPIESLLTERLRIADPEFEDGIIFRVVSQVELLRRIGIGVPVWAAELLRLGTQPPKVGWSWGAEQEERDFPALFKLGVFLYLKGERSLRDHLVMTLGEENVKNIANLQRVHSVLGKLTDLVRKLETTAEGLDLSEEWLKDLLRDVADFEGDYSHSRAFFLEAFSISRFPFLPSDGPADAASATSRKDLRKVRPEMVRQSRLLAKWADDCLAIISERRRDGHLFQPEVTTYPRVFRRLERAARSFPASAAVQTNVVQGVLGHHLLEDLDEHALELEEVAEALNPRKVWDFRDEGRRGSLVLSSTDRSGSTAEDFALYLLGRARTAEAIPKSLRMLQALLGPAEGATERFTNFRTLFRPFVLGEGEKEDGFFWRPAGVVNEEILHVDAKKARYLSLVLAELDQNQRKHGWKDHPSGSRQNPKFSLDVEGSVGKMIIQFWFDMNTGDEQRQDSDFGRLLRLAESKMEAPIDPNRARSVASSGTGFYLANLATAIVDWKFTLEAPTLENGENGSFRITLRGEVVDGAGRKMA